jgi:hypothetical protein
MKKILVLALLAIVFAGCEKEDENSNDNAEIQSSSWSKDNSVFKNEILGLSINGIGHYSYSTTTSNPEFRDYELKYVFNKPNIEIKFKDGSNFGSGYIEGDKMYLGKRGAFTRYR